MILCWAPKGGTGTSVVAAALAGAVRPSGQGLVVDLCGDQMAMAGVGGNPPGLGEWFASPPGPQRGPLDDLVLDVGRYRVLPRGQGAIEDASAVETLVAAVGSRPGVVVDAGRATAAPARALSRSARLRLMVLRSCYLAARAARRADRGERGSGARDAVVVVEERGRSLRAADIADSVGLPLAARVNWEAATARAVDAGLFGSRPPRTLARELLEGLAGIGVVDELQAG